MEIRVCKAEKEREEVGEGREEAALAVGARNENLYLLLRLQFSPRSWAVQSRRRFSFDIRIRASISARIVTVLKLHTHTHTHTSTQTQHGTPAGPVRQGRSLLHVVAYHSSRCCWPCNNSAVSKGGVALWQAVAD